MTAEPQEDSKPEASEKIQLQVNFEGRVVKFKLKRSGCLKKVLDAATKQFNMEKDTLRFTYNGKRIRGEEDETPENLEMEDEDEITAHLGQVGGTM
ncbi:hypothetical protein BV25DRAFT_1989400 [Artomyces pyxidatus]|uniref:Uncharacterized protein n=1 Tax=Artomyces pyxidatus TaxID=48021 RepID=A0ACB8TAG8_9AGAM|nr:hypothetical protein BV25DRAFT_1989400 [Artomyces pyxidatus]